MMGMRQLAAPPPLVGFEKRRALDPAVRDRGARYASASFQYAFVLCTDRCCRVVIVLP
jgi:hypothetical protein